MDLPPMRLPQDNPRMKDVRNSDEIAIQEVSIVTTMDGLGSLAVILYVHRNKLRATTIVLRDDIFDASTAINR